MNGGNNQAVIKTGVIGCGAMGRGLVYQSSVTPGIECVAVADLQPERCTAGFAIARIRATSDSSATDQVKAISPPVNACVLGVLCRYEDVLKASSILVTRPRATMK